MPFYRPTFRFIFLLVLLYSPAPAQAFTKKIKSANLSKFAFVTFPSAPGIQYACYDLNTKRSVLGKVKNSIFHNPVRAPYTAGNKAERRQQRKEFRKLVRHCSNKRLGNRSQVPYIVSPPVAPPAEGVPVIPPPAVQPPPAPPYQAAAIPLLELWKSQMISYGNTHCQNLKNRAFDFDGLLASTYYDAEWIYYQLADFTGDSKWLGCAEAAEGVYRDRYLVVNNGNLPGYWNFSHGLTRDFLSTGDQSSRNAVLMLSDNASYAPDSTPLSWTVDAAYSREVAYAIMSYLNAEIVGQPRKARLVSLVNQALGHFDQWFVYKNAEYVRPFMFALSSQALITYYSQVAAEPRILAAIKNGADWIWHNTWLESATAFKYTDRNHSTGGTEAAPDLNLLIAPVYAWLWHQTGEVFYRDCADRIFAGGVKNAYLVNAKQFNQNYRWSFDFVKWRSAAPLR